VTRRLYSLLFFPRLGRRGEKKKEKRGNKLWCPIRQRNKKHKKPVPDKLCIIPSTTMHYVRKGGRGMCRGRGLEGFPQVRQSSSPIHTMVSHKEGKKSKKKKEEARSAVLRRLFRKRNFPSESRRRNKQTRTIWAAVREGSVRGGGGENLLASSMPREGRGGGGKGWDRPLFAPVLTTRTCAQGGGKKGAGERRPKEGHREIYYDSVYILQPGKKIAGRKGNSQDMRPLLSHFQFFSFFALEGTSLPGGEGGGGSRS